MKISSGSNYYRERFGKLKFRAFTSSERIEELWVVAGFYEGVEELCHWWKSLNKLMGWEAFIDSVWIECTKLKEIFEAFCIPVMLG